MSRESNDAFEAFAASKGYKPGTWNYIRAAEAWHAALAWAAAHGVQSVPAAGIELMKLVSEYGALRYKSGRYDATNTSLDSPRDPLDNAGNAGRAYDRICEAIAAAYGVRSPDGSQQ